MSYSVRTGTAKPQLRNHISDLHCIHTLEIYTLTESGIYIYHRESVHVT